LASIEQSTKPGKSIIFVHGRGLKPDAHALQQLWAQSLRAGIERDYAKSGELALFDSTTTNLAYYGDLTNTRRESTIATYDEALDVADLHNTLGALSALGSAKKYRRASYEALPGRSSSREFLADIGAPILSTLRLTEVALAKRMPELAAYWNDDAAFAQNARQRVREPLRAAFARGDDILVIAHCLGSVITYDTLWELSHVEGLQEKLKGWITFGSPLADEFVKRRLHGSDRAGAERYPTNIVNWHNIAAEDDFTCHDETVANDFAPMQENRVISHIKDHSIYNLAVRYGKSNPHNFIGYLVHPRMTKLVAEWLAG
jgi:hypothetical protein